MENKWLNYSCEDIFHNSQDLYFKHPFGAISCEEAVTLRIGISKKKNINNVTLCLLEDNINNINNPKVLKYTMELETSTDIPNSNFHNCNEFNIYKCSFYTSKNPLLLFYYFEICSECDVIFYGNNSELLGGIGAIYKDSPPPYQITLYYKDSVTPNWFKKAIIYQIFPDRFFNSNKNGIISNPKKNSFIYGDWYDKPMYIKDTITNDILRWDFFGGNLKGIIEKLDYLKDLGINLIYLNPIFKSQSNHRYDTGNYKEIDPILGDEPIFKDLVKKAEEKDINIILDGVFNHTGSDSLYFNKYNTYDSNGAYNSPSSPYYKWYSFKNYPEDYESWWGVKALPSVNEMEPSYLNYIVKDNDSIIRHWMKTGIKGWRLDVADELPDEFIEEIKSQCKTLDKESVLIGEVWEDASNKVSYGVRRKYLWGKELDSVTNYPFRQILLDFFKYDINSEQLHKNFMNLYENYPLHHFYSLVNVIGTHDVERIYTVLKNISKERTKNTLYESKNTMDINFKIKVKNNSTTENKAKNHTEPKSNSENNLAPENKVSTINETLTIKLLKLLTLIQFTFPGVPLLYYGDEAGLEGLKDPLNRSTYPWGRENIELLTWYKTIISLRNSKAVFTTGLWKSLYFNEDIYGYIRCISNERDAFSNIAEDDISIVLINRSSNKTHHIDVSLEEYMPLINEKSVFINSLNSEEKIYVKNKSLSIDIGCLEGKIINFEKS